MGVLIIVGTVTLVVMIVQRAGKATSGAAPAAVAPALVPEGMSLGQPPGTRVGGIAPAADGRVAVWVQRPDGDRVVILDTRTGRSAGEVRLGD